MDHKSVHREFMSCRNIILEQKSYDQVKGLLTKGKGIIDLIFDLNHSYLVRNEWTRNSLINSVKNTKGGYPNHMVKLAELIVIGGVLNPSDVHQIKVELKEEILKWFHENKKSMHYKHGLDAIPISSRLGVTFLVLLFCQQEGLPVEVNEINHYCFSFMETEYSRSLVAKRMKGKIVKPLHPDDVKSMDIYQAKLFFREFIQDDTLAELMSGHGPSLSINRFASEITRGRSICKQISKEIGAIQREIGSLQAKMDRLSSDLAKLDGAKASMSPNAFDGISGVPGIRKLLYRICSDIQDSPELYLGSDIEIIKRFATSCIEQ